MYKGFDANVWSRLTTNQKVVIRTHVADESDIEICRASTAPGGAPQVSIGVCYSKLTLEDLKALLEVGLVHIRSGMADDGNGTMIDCLRLTFSIS